MEEENKVVENKVVENKVVLPWQFSTAGMILGFFFGVAPLLIALMGNYQMKKGYKAEELKKAFNIIFILAIVLIALFIIFYIIIIIAAIGFGSHSYGSYY